MLFRSRQEDATKNGHQISHQISHRYVTTFLYPAPGHRDDAIAEARRLAAAAPDDGQPTGEPVLEAALTRVLESDTARITATSVLAVALLLAVYYRRPRPTLAVLLPLGVAGALAVGLCLLAAFAVLPALLAVLYPARGVSAGDEPPPYTRDG